MTLDYAYYCHECDLFHEEKDALNEGGYNICPECNGDTLERFREDNVPKELVAEHGFGVSRRGP